MAASRKRKRDVPSKASGKQELDPAEAEIDQLKVPELQDKLRLLGLPVTGKKAQLQARLRHASEKKEAEIDQLKVPELQDKLRLMGLSVSGKKAQLQARLRHASGQEEEKRKKSEAPAGESTEAERSRSRRRKGREAVSVASDVNGESESESQVPEETPNKSKAPEASTELPSPAPLSAKLTAACLGRQRKARTGPGAPPAAAAEAAPEVLALQQLRALASVAEDPAVVITDEKLREAVRFAMGALDLPRSSVKDGHLQVAKHLQVSVAELMPHKARITELFSEAVKTASS